MHSETKRHWIPETGVTDDLWTIMLGFEHGPFGRAVSAPNFWAISLDHSSHLKSTMSIIVGEGLLRMKEIYLITLERTITSCGGLKTNDPIGSGTTKRWGFTGGGVVWLKEVCHCGIGLWGLLCLSEAQCDTQFTSCCLPVKMKNCQLLLQHRVPTWW